MTDTDVKDIIFWVAPKAPISGHVLSQERQPISRAFVALDLGGLWRTIHSSPEGYYQMNTLPLLPKNEKRIAQLSAYHKQYGFGKTHPFTYTSGERLTNVDITLTKGFLLSGRVTQPDNAPIEGVVVQFLDSKEGTGLSWQALTDSDGEYCFEEALPNWEGALIAKALGYDPKKKNLSISAGKNEERIDFVLIPNGKEAVITGIVVDRNGRPLERVRLLIQESGSNQGMRYTEQITSSDGHFEITDLYPNGAYNISAAMLTYSFLETTVFGIPANSENIVITLWFEPVKVSISLDDSALSEEVKNGILFVYPETSEFIQQDTYPISSQQSAVVLLKEPGQFNFEVKNPLFRGFESMIITEESLKQINLTIHLKPADSFIVYFFAKYHNGQLYDQPYRARLRLQTQEGQQPYENARHVQPLDNNDPELMGVADFLVYEEGVYELTVWDQWNNTIERTILSLDPLMGKDHGFVRFPDVVFP